MEAVAPAIEKGTDRVWAAAFVLIVAIVVVRSWTAFAWPTLAADDGVMAAAFFADPDWRGIFAPYRGYVTVLPHACGWLATFAPIGAWPALYAAFAGAAAALALSAFASRRFSFALPEARTRALLCVLVALAPHGNARLVSSLLWSYVSFGLLFALYAMAPLPLPGPRRAVDFLVRALLCVSSPLCSAVVPLLAWRAWRASDRGERANHAAMAMVAGGYVAFWCAPDPGLDHSPLRLLAGLVRLLDQRVVAETLLGGAIWPELGWLVHPFAALVLVGVAHWRARLSGPPRQFGNALLLLIVLMSAAVVFGRDHMGMPDVWWGNRYTCAQRVLFHLAIGVALAHGVRTLGPGERRSVAALGLAHALLLAGVGSEQYVVAAADGRRVAEFCAAAEIWAQQDAAQRAPLRLSRRGGWDIELR